MASSLLFRIKSTFDASGFKKATGSFKGVLGFAGKLVSGLFALTLGFKALGAAAGVFTVLTGGKLVAGLIKTNREAIGAELALTRLRTQLGLVGEGSEESLKKVVKFGEETGRITRFSAIEVQQATRLALQGTGNLNKALRQVSIAQDIAAATGRNLINTTRLLNLAQKGNVRILTQITDLRRADIKAAIRQGTLLDLLAKKFRGAASKEADTLAAKERILLNAQIELSKEVGKTGLRFNKFTVDVSIAANVLSTKFLRTIKDIRTLTGIRGGVFAAFGENFRDEIRKSVRALTDIRTIIGTRGGFAAALIESFKTANVDKSLESTTDKVFNFGKALEIRTLRLGRSRDEIRNLVRTIAKVDSDLLQAQRSGTRNLSQEQLERISIFRFAQQELKDILRSETEVEEDSFKARQKRLREIREERKKGLPDIVQQFKDFTQGGLNAGKAVQLIATDIGSVIKQQLISNKLIVLSAIDFEKVDGKIVATNNTMLKTLEILNNIKNAASDFTGKLSEAITARLQPLSDVTVNLSLTAEEIKAAVAEGARNSVKSAISQLVRNATNAGREERAQENFG